MIQYNEFMQGVAQVEKLGFSSTSPKYIPQEYLDNKKLIKLNPDLKIQTDGTILLDYKFLGHDTEKVQ